MQEERTQRGKTIITKLKPGSVNNHIRRKDQEMVQYKATLFGRPSHSAFHC